MPFMEALFYLILLSQIFTLSYHYPMVIIKRYEYIFKHYPAKDYPKFYPTETFVNPEKIMKQRLNIFKYMNFVIIVIGIAALIYAISSGFRLNEKGGAEIFVVIYFFLQFVPHLLLELHIKKHNRQMREAFQNHKRTAELKPRGLFDFISPFWVFFAIGIFICNVVLFLYYEGFGNSWDDDVYLSIGVSTIINIVFAFMVFRFVNGAKFDPHQAYSDQLIVIKSTVHVLVFTSIMMSVFFIVINSVREYGLDKWEPILMSVYFQIIVIFGLGEQLRSIKVEDVDFEVYRADKEAEPA